MNQFNVDLNLVGQGRSIGTYTCAERVLQLVALTNGETLQIPIGGLCYQQADDEPIWYESDYDTFLNFSVEMHEGCEHLAATVSGDIEISGIFYLY